MTLERSSWLSEEVLPRIALAALASVVGIGTFGMALALADASLKLVVFGLLGLGVFTVAALSGQPRAVLLFGWVFAFTYNRVYFSFGAIVGSHGGQGPYWILADLFLVPLLVLWIVDLVVFKRFSRPRGTRLWPWLLPFVTVCLVSVLLASRTDWGFFELLRVGKMALILAYFRYNVGKVEWMACLAALGCAVVCQALLGTLEVALGRTGVFGVLGLSDPANAELARQTYGGWMRAAGTMTFPPNLACYFLLTIPLFLALGFTLRNMTLRLAALATGLIGLVGLAVTLSRWPWVLASLQITLLLAGLVWLGQMPVKRALSFFCLGVFLVLLAILPFFDFIIDRITRDLDASIEFRIQENETGWRIAMDRPFLGVGPNNYRESLLKYVSMYREISESKESEAVEELNIRPLAAPHNGFLFLWAETGLLGLGTFCLYLLGVLRISLRTVRATSGFWRSASFGLLVGFLALMAQQVIDFSLWVDPLFYTFALMVGMINAAPALDDSAGATGTAPAS